MALNATVTSVYKAWLMEWLLLGIPVVILWFRVSSLTARISALDEDNSRLSELIRTLASELRALKIGAPKPAGQAVTEQPLREKEEVSAPVPERAETATMSKMPQVPNPVPARAETAGFTPSSRVMEDAPELDDVDRGVPTTPATPPASVPETEAKGLSLDWDAITAQTQEELSEPPKPVEIPKASKPHRPPRPYTPPPPPSPTLVERAFTAAKDWLFGGNTVARVGLVLLFIGLAFLLRYASEQYTLPVEYRYIGVALAAVALLALGWRLRLKKPAYGLSLQGAGIAVLYLTSFAAMRLHNLLPPLAVFGVLIALTVCAAILAILQDALGLACAAALGGFVAPVLVSTGSGDHVALFSYFTLLNAGILSIAWFKAWRPLNLIGFAGTFCIGIAWGIRAYVPELFASTEPFLILFFLMYVGIGLLFARRKLLEAADAPEEAELRTMLRWSASNTDYLDGTMMFGPPLIGFGLQCVIVQHIEFGMAFSALALGLFYLAMALLLRSRPRVSLLMEICLSLGVIFGTLAIPLAFDARWTSAAWAVEGAGIYWLSLKQQRRLARMFSLLLITAATISWFPDLRLGADTLLQHASPLGAALLGAALLFCHRALRRAPEETLAPWDRPFLPAFAISGLVFLYLLAPLNFALEYTVVAWALAGALTFLVGLYLGSGAFIFCAFGVFAAAALGWLTDLRLGADTLLQASRLGAAVLGVTLLGSELLFCAYWSSRYHVSLVLRRAPQAALAERIRSYLLAFAVSGLVFLYLLAPLNFALEYTLVTWALAGVATLFAGLTLGLPLYLESRAFLACAFGVLAVGTLGWLTDLRLGADTLLQGSALAAALLGAALLVCHFAVRSARQEALTDWVRPYLPVFAVSGLSVLYLLAPLFFALENTVIAWALAGVATIFVGLRLNSRAFLACAFGVQLVAGGLFLCNLHTGETEVLASGWMGMLSAALVGFALIASAIITQNDAMTRQNEAFARRVGYALLVGLVFINLALLFVLDWGDIALAWAVSGLLILWLGLWQRQQGTMFYFGLALEAVAGITFVFNNAQGLAASNPWASAALALAAMCGAWRMHHVASRQTSHTSHTKRPSALDPDRIAALSALLLVWGVSWWVWAVADRIAGFARIHVLALDEFGYLLLLALSLSGLLWMAVARFAQWRALALASLLPLAAALWALVAQGVPPELLVILSWGVFFLAHFILLRGLAGLLPAIVESWAHVLGAWLLVGVAALAAHNFTGNLFEAASAWRWLAWALAPSLYLWLTGSERGQFWPFTAFAREYRETAALPIMLSMLLWFWMANLSAGVSAPLPYAPLLNPLELGLLLVLLACWNWSRARLPEFGLSSHTVERGTAIAGGGFVFILAMLAVCRAAHFWGDVPFNSHALTASMVVQAGWSLVGTFFALTLMIGGSRRGQRSLWMVGAALVGLVVLKLFFVELSGHGGLARIVSFIGVGVLLLVVGYFSPLPPRAESREGEDE